MIELIIGIFLLCVGMIIFSVCLDNNNVPFTGINICLVLCTIVLILMSGMLICSSWFI